MAKPLHKFMVSVPEWYGSEFILHECYYDDLETAAAEFIEQHDDDYVVIDKHQGIEVLIRRLTDDTVHKLVVVAEATTEYTAYSE